jgi:hypothetical protein
MCETRSRVGAAVASRTFDSGEPCLAWSMTRPGRARDGLGIGLFIAGRRSECWGHRIDIVSTPVAVSFFRFRRAFRCDGTIFQTGMNHIASPHLPQRRGMGEGAVLEFT